ncbi:hypothetical protein G1K46_08435 [Tenacibaculum finnmarkense]|uniref:hypothetical protein n=1 Tax=Tenacibaculum finnmarkense TaxID=2781243 RepID=UPI001EFAE0C0|nr:hypothetical protein [Tenacibaculum finnmarkense]MCG8762757.1 hypothetical protein [Tenacibaculum finnmarkense]MCG8788134.1 hypothetical protein [Tenacibaculum finnmarkense]
MSSQEKLLKELIENQTKAFDKIDQNFENLNNRVSSIEKKLSLLADNTDKGFDDVKTELKKISLVTSYPEQYKNVEGLA